MGKIKTHLQHKCNPVQELSLYPRRLTDPMKHLQNFTKGEKLILHFPTWALRYNISVENEECHNPIKVPRTENSSVNSLLKAKL